MAKPVRKLEYKNVAEILDGLQLNFRRILPKKLTQLSPYKFLSNQSLVAIVELFDYFVQLLFQCYLFCEGPQKLEIHNLIDEIIYQKQQKIRQSGLPHHDLFISDFKFQNASLNTLKVFLKNHQEFPHCGVAPERLQEMIQPNIDDISKLYSLEIAPQVSVYQNPLLEIFNLIKMAQEKQMPEFKKFIILEELIPLVSKQHIPVQSPIKESWQQKFSPMHDTLLLNGLKKYQSKNLPKIQQVFLPDKTLEEIKNRFKNLTRFKSGVNLIKNWRIYSIAPLNEIEELNLQKGKLWFGKESYKKISKYFLPHRSAEFLQQNEASDNQLVIKRSQNYFDLGENDIQEFLLRQNAEATVSDNDRDFMVFLQRLSQLDFQSSLRDLTKNQVFSIQLNPLQGEQECGDQNFIIFKNKKFFSQKIKFLKHKVSFGKRKVVSERVRHRVLDLNESQELSEPSTQKLCPSIKELQRIIDRVGILTKNKISAKGDLFYERLEFP